MTAQTFRFDFDNDLMVVRDKAGKPVDADRIGGIQDLYLEISSQTAEEIMAVSKEYEAFCERIKNLTAAKGFKIEAEPHEEVADDAIVSGWNIFEMTTSRCYHGTENMLNIDGERVEFFMTATKVKFWEDGLGIDFCSYCDDEKYDIVFGCGRSMLQDFLDTLKNDEISTPKM